jgi:hypothetical protein
MSGLYVNAPTATTNQVQNISEVAEAATGGCLFSGITF